ncbi:MAG: pre-peptidase C-terminal domain-containing protein [Gammaproteobacteria bacterium]|nr:pre-peptidase C-terminal domain-containing protein [Gammaproteobacteria bacterium]
MLSGCDSPPADQSPALSKIQLSPADSVIRALEVPLSLNLSMLDQYGAPIAPLSVPRWESDAPQIVNVSATGVVTAHQPGTAMITVRVDHLLAQAQLRVDTGIVPLSGSVKYEDWPYDATQGLLPQSVNRPVRFATINLLDEQGKLMATQNTQTGSYSFAQWLPSQGSLQVIASADDSGKRVQVKDLSGQPHQHVQAIVAGFDVQDVVVASANNANYGAFNILDVMLTAHQFMSSSLGATPLPALNVFWRPGSNFETSYYCNDNQPATPGLQCEYGPGIYVLSEQTSTWQDNDEFDDDVLWHEYGHFIAFQFSRDDSSGGCHAFSDNFQQMPLAWSEGWGNYFQGAVKITLPLALRSSQESLPGMYVDTVKNGAPMWVDFSDPDLMLGDFRFATNETSIAKILLDVTQQFGFATVWQVVSSSAWVSNSGRRANLELFWDIATGRMSDAGVAPINEASLLPIFSARGVDYQQDAYEPNDSRQAAMLLTAGVSQSHTLYGAAGVADQDWYAINATAGVPFTVTTSNLRNGADTEMWLYAVDAQGNLDQVGYNNDPEPAGIPPVYAHSYNQDVCGLMYGNTLTGFAARVQYTPPTTGTYYVKVASSQLAEFYTGQYGSYQIDLQ